MPSSGLVALTPGADATMTDHAPYSSADDASCSQGELGQGGADQMFGPAKVCGAVLEVGQGGGGCWEAEIPSRGCDSLKIFVPST